jgi:hypothetical protein
MGTPALEEVSSVNRECAGGRRSPSCGTNGSAETV